MKENIDFKELNKLKIAKADLEQVEKYIKRLEKCILSIKETLNNNSDVKLKILKISNYIDAIEVYI